MNHNSQQGLVSVMMPAYNAETYIEEAIRSVLVQAYTDWELIIVNDGSIDRTPEIASQFADPRIKLIQQENGGEAYARNTALKHMRGEFLAFLDSDDLFLPNHIKASIGYLQKNARVDGVYTDGYYMDQAGNRLQTLASRRRGPFQGRLFEEVVYSSDVFGPPVCVALRTDLIYKHELEFDKNIIIGPDWNFFTKYAEVGNFGYIDQTTCLYRLHGDNISIRTGLQKRAIERAKCRISAIRMKSFQSCSIGTRVWVFYDLLVNLLVDCVKQQIEITQWPQFRSLPKKEQARLFRLMASKTIIYGKDHSWVANWLEKSRQLNPGDGRAFLLSWAFHINPELPAMLLKAGSARQLDPRMMPPFGDMNLERGD